MSEHEAVYPHYSGAVGVRLGQKSHDATRARWVLTRWFLRCCRRRYPNVVVGPVRVGRYDNWQTGEAVLWACARYCVEVPDDHRVRIGKQLTLRYERQSAHDSEEDLGTCQRISAR